MLLVKNYNADEEFCKCLLKKKEKCKDKIKSNNILFELDAKLMLTI